MGYSFFTAFIYLLYTVQLQVDLYSTKRLNQSQHRVARICLMMSHSSNHISLGLHIQCSGLFPRKVSNIVSNIETILGIVWNVGKQSPFLSPLPHMGGKFIKVVIEIRRSPTQIMSQAYRSNSAWKPIKNLLSLPPISHPRESFINGLVNIFHIFLYSGGIQLFVVPMRW